MWYIEKVEMRLADSQLFAPRFGRIVEGPFQADYNMTLVDQDTNEHLSIFVPKEMPEESAKLIEKYRPFGVFKTDTEVFSFICVDKFSIRLVDLIDSIEQLKIDHKHPLFPKLFATPIQFKPIDDFKFFYRYQTSLDVDRKTGYCSLFHIMRYYGDMQYNNEYYVRVSAPRHKEMTVFRVRFIDPVAARVFIAKTMLGSPNVLKNIMTIAD